MGTAFFSSYKIIILIFGAIKAAFLSGYKNIILVFALFRTAFSYFFYFSLYKMVHSKTLEISIGTIIKNPEVLRFVPDECKTNKMWNMVEC